MWDTAFLPVERDRNRVHHEVLSFHGSGKVEKRTLATMRGVFAQSVQSSRRVIRSPHLSLWPATDLHLDEVGGYFQSVLFRLVTDCIPGSVVLPHLLNLSCRTTTSVSHTRTLSLFPQLHRWRSDVAANGSLDSYIPCAVQSGGSPIPPDSQST